VATKLNVTDISGWIPYSLRDEEGQLLCYWLDSSGTSFTEPFFDETIRKLRTTGTRHKFRSASSIESMSERAENLNHVLPAAFIFHISRCGSTLVSQMLATSPVNISLAEVPFFDDILRLRFKRPDFEEAAINELLKASLKYYSYNIKPNGDARRLFIKADSWHIFFYEQLRRIFPETPFILMYRSPDEVFRSHRKEAGMHAVPGLIEPELFGFDESVVEEPAETYLANVLAAYLDKYLEISQSDNNCMLLNYNEGPAEMIDRIASFAKINFSENELTAMDERSQRHSKRPGEQFNEPRATGYPDCLQTAMELYQALNAKRFAIQ